MPYTVYDMETHKIVARVNTITRSTIPDGCDFIIGDYEDFRFRINPEDGVPYPFIDQDQLPWLIRLKCKSLLRAIAMTDSEVGSWIAQSHAFETLNLQQAKFMEEVYTRVGFRVEFEARFAERQRLLKIAEELTNMDPIPQDAEDDKYWIKQEALDAPDTRLLE